jgi:hypothetical protein
MEAPRGIDASRNAALSVRFVVVAAAIVMIAYTVTLMAARTQALGWALSGALANTVPVILFGLGARHIIIRYLVDRPIAVQVAGHVVVGTAFALLCYWLLMVLLGLANGVSAVQFNVEPFEAGAMAWQTLQNATTYGVIAALSYLQAQQVPVTVILSDPSRGEPAGEGLSRYFIRSGEDIRPIDVDEIVSIAGADDYAEVHMMDGSHLVRMTLAEFEAALDPERFVRVHRSRIVNMQRLDRAESAGNGRMLLHMENGEMIQASRTGSRLLRERVL